MSNEEHEIEEKLIEKIILSLEDNWQENQLHLSEDDCNWKIFNDAYYKSLNIILASSLLDDFISSNYTEECKSLNLNKHELIFPIIFLFRHYLEISLKNLLLSFNKYLDYENIKFSSHNLEYLYNQFKSINKEINLHMEADEINDDFTELDEIIDNFNNYDRGSFSFRYPCNKENTKNFQKAFIINALNLSKSLKIAHSTFNKLISKIELLEEEEDDTEYFENNLNEIISAGWIE